MIVTHLVVDLHGSLVRTRTLLVLVGAALIAALTISGYFVDQKLQEWNRRVEEAQSFARAETARADSVVFAAEHERARADSLARVARVDTVRVREILEKPVIKECEPFVIQRDSLINELLVKNEQLAEAYEVEHRAADKLRAAYDALLVVNDSLMAVLDDRPLPLPKWAPSVQVGFFVGMCADGHPCAGVGAGLTWKVKIPMPF